jgi:hypothetical protein
VLSGETISAQITWVNNLATRIIDGQIIVNLSGNVFDKSLVKPGNNGFYDSINSQIIWDKSSKFSDFKNIDSSNIVNKVSVQRSPLQQQRFRSST